MNDDDFPIWLAACLLALLLLAFFALGWVTGAAVLAWKLN